MRTRYRTRHIAFALATVCATSFAAVSAGAGEVRAVIELFTSQGCSSCPPADKLLGELAHDPTIIAMSLPVDYWDYLGWKDTLALRGHSNRERAYAEARGDREVFTPQAVINGVSYAVGSDRAAIEKAIAQTRNEALTLPVKVGVAGGKISVEVAAGPDSRGPAEVWLCPITRSAQVKIGRGENRGQTLSYFNVVRRWVKLGEWSGKAESFSVPIASLSNGNFSIQDIDHVDVFVQSGAPAKPGLMLGAATASLR